MERTAADTEVTVGDRVFFRDFHDTYHTGQLELLRHRAGHHGGLICPNRAGSRYSGAGARTYPRPSNDHCAYLNGR